MKHAILISLLVACVSEPRPLDIPGRAYSFPRADPLPPSTAYGCTYSEACDVLSEFRPEVACERGDGLVLMPDVDIWKSTWGACFDGSAYACDEITP